MHTSFKSAIRYIAANLAVAIIVIMYAPPEMRTGCYAVQLLALVQNTAFSMVSRSRNRNDIRYHLIASILSNSIWFLTFQQLLEYKMTFLLFIPYTVGTVTGSVWGAKISMVIERMLMAASDDHLENTKLLALEARIEVLEHQSITSAGSSPAT